MPVPETSIYKNNGPEFFKYNIGLSRQAPSPQSETEAQPVQYGPDALLRASVTALDAAHIPASSLRCKSVCHQGARRASAAQVNTL